MIYVCRPTRIPSTKCLFGDFGLLQEKLANTRFRYFQVWFSKKIFTGEHNYYGFMVVQTDFLFTFSINWSMHKSVSCVVAPEWAHSWDSQRFQTTRCCCRQTSLSLWWTGLPRKARMLKHYMLNCSWTLEEVSVHESFSKWFRFDLTGESLQLFCPGDHLK